MTTKNPSSTAKNLLSAFIIIVALSGVLSQFVYAKGIAVQTIAGEESQFGSHINNDKWTVVMVWTTYCGVCRQEYPKLSAFHDRHKDSKATVLGISLDGFGSGEKVDKYREKQKHAFPSLLANSTEFAEPYERTTGTNFSGTPTYLIFDDKQQLQAFKNGKLDISELEAFMAD